MITPPIRRGSSFSFQMSLDPTDSEENLNMKYSRYHFPVMDLIFKENDERRTLSSLFFCDFSKNGVAHGKATLENSR